jgi:hypothetical protein
MRLQNVRKARAFLKLKRGNSVVFDLAKQRRRRLFNPLILQSYLSKDGATRARFKALQSSAKLVFPPHLIDLLEQGPIVSYR